MSSGEKAATAYRTISEVAGDLDVPPHVLRFWESRFPQIRPRKGAGGRRYYRPADIDLLRRIRKLLYDEGYTIRGAQLALKDAGGAPDDDDDPIRDELTAILEDLRELRRDLLAKR